MQKHKFNPDCDDCQRGRLERRAVRDAAKIITPGAWWDGKPPNDHQKKRVTLATKKARAVLAVFKAANV